ncbi:ABC transporter ATP-binding protein [Acidomonas methanolica]|uniref:ABC transporter ATP-binding protein n=1 Tax=Acidomonas methanolica TaxID=437 RepID=UPI002119CB14|nr:ABC transporter ATP-binding protein [Acidomonas methanolica]MCQ9156904.1 ABC transporter ATP-binding protein [Acidomonas methanolica]
MTSAPVLVLDDLSVRFGTATVLDGVSLHIARGETLALIGESGSGKSVTALAVMGLLRGGTVSGGRIMLTGRGGQRDLARLPEREMRHLRGGEIAMIFQEPMSALNPLMRIGAQILESLTLHRPDLRTPSRRREEAAALLAQTGIADPPRALRAFPHELSGGMRQRVMIAMAFCASPALLIADEPTTALDAATRGRILALIRAMAASHGTATLFITHDFGAAAAVADRAAVLYAGRLLEDGPIAAVLDSPAHPYTQGLIASLPDPAALHPDERGRQRLHGMPGTVPTPGRRPEGCVFQPRCPIARPACTAPMRAGSGALRPLPGGRRAACLALETAP